MCKSKLYEHEAFRSPLYAVIILGLNFSCAQQAFETLTLTLAFVFCPANILGHSPKIGGRDLTTFGVY